MAWSGARWKSTDRAMAEALEQQARSLLSAGAVRARAAKMLEIGLAGGLRHFTIDLSHTATARTDAPRLAATRSTA